MIIPLAAKQPSNNKSAVWMKAMFRVAPEEVFAAANCIWRDKTTAIRIASDTMAIINIVKAKKSGFFSGRSGKHVVGGLFYLLGCRYGSMKRQKELADALGTSDVTIRDAYRRWLSEFPDLFEDVIDKFAEDSNLKYFVLHNLNKTENKIAKRS
jgi:hypothetical protein